MVKYRNRHLNITIIKRDNNFKFDFPSHMSKPEKRVTRRHATEKAVAQSLLGDFDVKKSKGLALIESILGTDCFESMSRNSLLSVTTVFSRLTDIPFPRNFSRRKALIIKWYDDNWEVIEQAKQFIYPEYAHSKLYQGQPSA